MEKILSHRPSRYLQQGLVNCGFFAVEGVLSAYDRNPTKKEPKEFHNSLIHRVFGLTPPRLMVDVLNKNGINAQYGNTKNTTNEARLNFLKENLSHDTPILIHIGAGYWGNGLYKSILGKVIGHWISIWGYDDERKVFYIYDSGVATRFHQNVPIGNIARPYNDVLRDWGQGITPVPRKYDYVKIIN